MRNSIPLSDFLEEWLKDTDRKAGFEKQRKILDRLKKRDPEVMKKIIRRMLIPVEALR